MPQNQSYLYEFGSIDRLKRHLAAGKKVIFRDIGTFHLETYGKNKRYIKFHPDSELKNVIWEVLYYGIDRKKKDCSDIANHLINLNTIDLVNFGKIYIYFDPGHYTWHDFHGETWVDPKPRIKFLKHEKFQLFNEKVSK